ncbi:hypothetical protein A3715_00015 [Oleiphilus sp. HI0009]|nr:hypothetical protein A3715_00015 [Oleiphilus sp. HI0009]
MKKGISRIVSLFVNHEDHPVFERSVGILTVIVSVVIFLMHANEHYWIEIIICFLVGWFIADALSYLVHYAGDTYKFENHPNLRKIAADFVAHHYEPEKVIENGWFRSGTLLICCAGITSLLIMWALKMEKESVAYLILPITVIGTVFVPTFHAWAHDKNSNKGLLRFLRFSKLVLSSEDHISHHIGDNRFEHNWGLVNGWSNHVLDPIFSYKQKKKN